MLDAEFWPGSLPTTDPPCKVVAFYLSSAPGSGGAAHAWTRAEIIGAMDALRAEGGGWILPIYVPVLGENPRDAAAHVSYQLGWLTHDFGFPFGRATVAIDREEGRADITPGWLEKYQARTAGMASTMGYTSASEALTISSAHFKWWAEYRPGQEPFMLPGADATQYGTFGAYDLSLISDQVPLWPIGASMPPTLAAPIVAIVSSSTGRGYWLVGADGGVFAFGDATVLKSPLPGTKLARLIVGATATPSGHGLWLVGADGGVFAIGDAAPTIGSLPGLGYQPAP
jgi:hypothetical protein